MSCRRHRVRFALRLTEVGAVAARNDTWKEGMATRTLAEQAWHVELDPDTAGETEPAPAPRAPSTAASTETPSSRPVQEELPLPPRRSWRADPRIWWFATLGVINLAGLPYYLLPVPERIVSPLHVWLKPTGYVGQSAGILGFAGFLFLWLYPVRKRVRWLSFTGPMNRWLDVHIAVGLSVPVLATMHASWRFQGLIGWGYGAMITVALSGVVGRYLYVRIPRSRSGVELSAEHVAQRRRALLRRIASSTGLAPDFVERALAVEPRSAERGLMRSLIRLIADDFRRWRAASALRRAYLRRQPREGRLGRATLSAAVKLARREIALEQQAQMLDATQRLFKFWHVAHLPIAIGALLAVLIHVALAVALGVTWLW